MNILNNTAKAVQQPSLPPLVKGSTTYKLIVPRKVEEKIRYLIRKFPSTEWSGVLFYTHTGKFEDGSLEIHCQDIYPMDLGTGTFTDFKMDESVIGYIAENFDLFGCDMGLVHSHHSLGAFISGTDSNTIRAEGNDTNCFVSLVVDTKGTYVAALTRKIKEKKQVTTADMGSSYEFFGEGSINLADSQHKTSTVEVVDREIIEYFMLDVQVEQVDNPLAYLDTRFEEIQSTKKKNVVINPLITVKESDDKSSHNWWYSKRKQSAETKEAMYCSPENYQEQSLFSDEEMGKIDSFDWEPDPTIIHKLVCQMVTCSLIINDNIDLKQWIVRWMDKKYTEIFNPESTQFDEWKEFIVDFMISQYIWTDDNASDDDYDLLQSKIASAINDELCQYAPDGVNDYIDEYKEVLTRYIYE